MDCNEAVAALVASLETGDPMTDEQREHIRTCERCRELLDSAKQFQTLLAGNGIAPPPVEATLAAAESEVHQRRARRLTRVIVGVAVVFFLGVAFMLFPFGDSFSADERFFAFTVGILIAIGLAIPVLLLLLIVRGTAKRRLYKRLKPEKQLSGVCLGLAESFGWNVSLVRLAFFVLLFFDGIGFWLYVLLDLAMPVHPDDRRHLLRFKLQRWFRRRMGHAENHAG